MLTYAGVCSRKLAQVLAATRPPPSVQRMLTYAGVCSRMLAQVLAATRPPPLCSAQPSCGRADTGTQITCFTGTKVQILTLQLVAQGLHEGPATQKLFLLQAAMLQVNFFSETKMGKKCSRLLFLSVQQYKSTDT